MGNGDDDSQAYLTILGLEIPIPDWIAEILETESYVVWTLYLAGVVTGIFISGIAFFIGFYLSYT